MDTKLIKQYGDDILSYRIRTARQKKRMQYEDFDKHLIQLYTEEKKLRKQERQLGWEPLVPPVQKGWKRYFVLRDDVARSRYADFFQNILNKINTHDWSHRRDFIAKRKRKKHGRKIYEVKPQKLLEPHECHFAKLAFNDAEKRMFHEVISYKRWNIRPVKRYVFNEPWRFVLRVKPNIITRIRVKDAVLQSQMVVLANYLERNDLRKRQSRLIWGRYQWKYWKDAGSAGEENPFRNKSLPQILDIIKYEME